LPARHGGGTLTGEMDFMPLTLADKPRVDAALAADPPEASELTFTNLFVWGGKRRVSLSREGGELCFLCEERGDRFFLPPVGARDLPAAAATLFAAARRAGFEPRIERVPRAAAERLAGAGFAAAPDRDSWDYVYAVRDLALLEGRHFDGKRNQIRRLTEARRCEYRPITPALAAACLALEEKWCDLRACALDPGLEAERAAIAACFEHWGRLGLTGGAVFVDGALKAFSVAERLAPDTAVVHFEKADPAIPGLYQLVNAWFCREALGGFAFVNREQDLGIPGLRRAKESYRPHHLVEKHTVRPARPGAGRTGAGGA
jgi:hypothetical protein